MKSSILITHENCEGSILLTRRTRNSKKTIKNARKKLGTSVAPAMPCKIMKNCGSGASNKIKTKLACILEAGESTRLRMGNSVPNHHEDHIAGKGDNSLKHETNHYNNVFFFSFFFSFFHVCDFFPRKGSVGWGVGCPIFLNLLNLLNLLHL